MSVPREPLLPDVGRPAELWRQHRRHQLTVALVVTLSAAAAIAAVALTLDRAWLAVNPCPWPSPPCAATWRPWPGTPTR